MEYHKRRPDLMIEVIRPDYNAKKFLPSNLVARFSSTPYVMRDSRFSNALISYNFKEALDTIDGDFSMTLTVEKDSERRTWLDKLRIRDLVLISEFDRVQYAGYIDDIRLSAKMAGGGKPDRKILVKGGNFGKMLSSFKLVLDQFLFAGVDAQAEISSTKLMDKLAQIKEKDSGIASALEAIYKDYIELALEMGNVNPGGRGMKAILDYYVDYSSELSRDLKIKYAFAPTLYQVGENSILDIWRALVHPPLNELFGRWSPLLSVLQLVFREAPFDADKWRDLEKNIIPPILVKSYDVGKSDQEVFTFYASVLPGQPFDWKQAMAIDGASVIIDKEKWSKYGYRPLIVKNRYFNRDQLENFSDQEVPKIMKNISTKMKKWFAENDEFVSGTLEMMTIDPNEWRDSKYSGLENPRIGEKIGLLDGEFYVESSEHSWSYRSPMITKLSISRGYKYNPDGTLDRPIYGGKEKTYETGGYEIER